jgi:hypothetical protein
VKRTPGSLKNNLKFDYDGYGKRVAKHMLTSAGVWKNSTYYIRDANGILLASYVNENDPNTHMASFAVTKRQIYGTKLLGIETSKVEMIGAPPPSASDTLNRVKDVGTFNSTTR